MPKNCFFGVARSQKPVIHSMDLIQCELLSTGELPVDIVRKLWIWENNSATESKADGSPHVYLLLTLPVCEREKVGDTKFK